MNARLLERLAFTHKHTLVGNLLRSTSLGLGFGWLKWMERDLSSVALRGFVVSGDALTEPTEREFVWRPDRVTVRYPFGDCAIEESKSAHEYFNPLTGEELGAVDLGWTGLCNDMIVRHVCGVQRADDDWHFAPLDIGLAWYALHLPAQNIHVRFDRPAGYRVER